MIPLLVIAAWIVVLLLVAGTCAAARTGDRQASAPAGSELTDFLPWEPAEQPELSARVSVHAGRPAQSGAAPIRSGGVAA